MKLDPAFVKMQIDHLLLAHPELAEDEVLRADSIEGQTDAFEFMTRVVKRIGAAKSIAAGTAAYIDELREREARFERREYALRQLLFKVMEAGGLSKAELPEASLSIRNGVPKVVITDEAQIPDEFFRIKKEPDKSRIKAAIQAHENVPGAALSNSEPTLTIRVK